MPIRRGARAWVLTYPVELNPLLLNIANRASDNISLLYE